MDTNYITPGVWYDRAVIRPLPAHGLPTLLVPFSGLVLFGLGIASALAGPPAYFDLTASFVPPAKPGGEGAIAVRFVAKGPAIHLNEEPAPRVKLDPAQKVLLDRQPPARTAAADPDSARYLDLSRPVRFAVAYASGAPRGAQTVKATVVYFYCSSREGWCRRGSTDVEVGVTVP